MAEPNRFRYHSVTADETGWRLDKWLKHRHPQLPYGLLAKWLRVGTIRVDGKKAEGKCRLQCDQQIRFPAETTYHVAPLPAPRHEAQIDLRPFVIYEDADIIAINKPAGLATQGGTKIRLSVDSSLPSLVKDSEPPLRLVHRLDKETSGVLLIARHRQEAAALTKAFAAHTLQKVYWAVVSPCPAQRKGIIAVPLHKQEVGGQEKMVPDHEGLYAETAFRVLETCGSLAWVELMPHTGRTHQLRVHCAWMQTPILGDGKYGKLKRGRHSGLHLHARYLTLPNRFTVEAPLPPHMEKTFADCAWKIF